MFFSDHIYDYGVNVAIDIEHEIDDSHYKDVNDIMHLVHILLSISTNYDPTVFKLLSNTLVGLGLTITDGRKLIENLIDEIQNNNET